MKSIEKFIQLISATTGVNTVFDLEPDRPASADLGKKVIHLPKKENWWYYDENELKVLALHEAGHIKYTDILDEKTWEEIMKPFEKDFDCQDLFQCVNSFEDLRINDLLSQRFSGAYNLFEEQSYLTLAKFSILNDRRIDQLKYMPKAKQFLFLNHFRHYRTLDYFDWIKDLDQNLIDDLNKLWSMEMEIKGKAKNTLELIRDILIPKVFPLYIKYLEKCPDKKKMEEMIKKMMSAFKKFIKENGDKIRKEMEKREQELDKTERAKKKLMDAKGDKCEEALEQNIKGITKQLTTKRGGRETGKDQDPVILDLFDSLLPKMKRAVNILKEQSYNRLTRGLKRGKICSPRLYKSVFSSPRIFQKKIETAKDEKITVSLLVDTSGSMRGERMKQATVASFLLAKSLERADHFCIINKFNDQLHPVKKINERVRPEMFYEMAEGADGGTIEGVALDQTIEELSKAKGQKKLLIVINDGGTNDHDHLEEVIAKVPKDIGLMAIGIQSNEVKEYYKNCIVLNDVNSLPNELIKIFKDLVGKRA